MTMTARLARGRYGQRNMPCPRAQGSCRTPEHRSSPASAKDTFHAGRARPCPPCPSRQGPLSFPCSPSPSPAVLEALAASITPPQGLFQAPAPPAGAQTQWAGWAASKPTPLPPAPLARPRRYQCQSAEGLLGKPPLLSSPPAHTHDGSEWWPEPKEASTRDAVK